MGNQQHAQARRRATASRTGVRKVKKKNDENDPPTTPTPSTHPRPRPAFKGVLGGPDNVKSQSLAAYNETAAAEILISMASVGRKPKRTKSAMERVFEQVCNVGSDEDEGEDEDEDDEGDLDQLDSDEEGLQEVDDDDLILPLDTPKKIWPKFDIPFEVPVGGATRDLRGITSSSTFHNFRVQLASKMETQMSLLSHIGYVPSYKPKNPKPLPKLLEDEEAWEALLSDVYEYISSSKAKKAGKGTVKPFSIAIFDTSGPDSKEAVKKGTKKKMPESEAITSPGELSDHELLRKLEKRHHCSKCDRSCIILQTGDHYALTHADTATWVTLLKRHQATIDHPPDDLKLNITRQRSAKKALHATMVKDESTPTTPPWMEQMMMIMGASAIQTSQALRFVTGGPTEAPITPRPHQYTEGPVQTPYSPSPILLKRTAELDPPIEIDNSPDISTWLFGLDMDPVRGKLNVNYQQYAQALQQAGLLELADLDDLEVDKLQELGGMPFGTAKRVLKFAALDILKLDNSKRPRFD